MKLLLLVSLPFLASTFVTLAKSTLNEGRQDVTDLLDMSPRGLSTARILKQATLRRRHQAENAEERSPSSNIEKLALELKEEAPALLEKELEAQEAFLKLNVEMTDEFFRSQAFQQWMQAVEESEKKGAGKIIGKVLVKSIPEDTLLSMLDKAKGGTLSDAEYTRLFGYLLSQLMEKYPDLRHEMKKGLTTLPQYKHTRDFIP